VRTLKSEHIAQWETYFPEKLVREQVKKAMAEPIKIQLADFTPKEVSPFGFYGIAGAPYIPVTLISAIEFTPSPVSKISEIKYASAYSISNESPSVSVSPSVSKSVSVSDYLSPSPSVSVSPSPSKSISPSPSKSVSPSPSKSVSPSPSKSVSPSPPSPSPYSPSPSPPPSPSPYYYPPTKKQEVSFFKKQEIKPIKRAQAFLALIKRQGKYKALIGLYPKAKAIRTGEIAARTTLARSFKVVPTNRFIEYQGEEAYQPGEMVFRPYKIRKGMKIPLEDEWIQRAKYSLASFGERKEIKAARQQVSFFKGSKSSMGGFLK
jgi:hypothetical protein